MVFVAMFLGITVSANSDGPTFVTPKQYSEYKINSDVVIKWNSPASTYGTVDHYIVAVRKFYSTEDVTDSSAGERIVNTIWPASSKTYTIGGSVLKNYYDASTSVYKYRKYRISIGAVMTDGTKRWSDHQYFYLVSHNTPVDKPISFHIYNGFTDESKEQIYYACQNWNNSLNIGREIVNTYPYSMGTNEIFENTEDGINIVTKRANYDKEYTMATIFSRTSSYQMREADIIVNTRYPWANSSQVGKYNFYNSITHEMGHVVGLTDKYDSWAAEWTMYGVGSMNTSYKTTLENQDILNGRSLF